VTRSGLKRRSRRIRVDLSGELYLVVRLVAHFLEALQRHLFDLGPLIYLVLEGPRSGRSFDPSWPFFVLVNFGSCEGVVVFRVEGIVLSHRLLVDLLALRTDGY